METMEETKPEQFFSVSVNIEENSYEFLVIPRHDPKKQDYEFMVGLDGEDCGILVLEFPERWVWSKGNLGEDMAEAIGNQIDKHYM